LFICVFDTLRPFCTQFFFALATAQEAELRMIIKGYVMIAMQLKLEKIFVDIFPEKLKKNVQKVNAEGLMKMRGKDDNSAKLLFGRFYNAILIAFGCKNVH
jgi:hypothetical protein